MLEFLAVLVIVLHVSWLCRYIRQGRESVGARALIPTVTAVNGSLRLTVSIVNWGGCPKTPLNISDAEPLE